jgi:hypothetical protein
VPGVIYSNPDPTAPLVAYFSDLVFDPYYMPNGPYFDQAQNIGFTVSSYTNRQFAIVGLDTTNLIINVTDRNLGSWLSPYDSNNAIMGFSYDILNGVPTLTMGFGSVPAMNAGGYVTYSANSLKSLGRSRYLHYTNYIGGVPVISAFDYQKSCNPEYSSFLNTHGVWSTSDLNSASVAGNAVFYTRYDAVFQWQFSVDNYGSFYIDGSLIYTYSGSDPNNFRSVQSGNIALTTGSHTVTWDCGNSGGPGAFGISLTYLSGNCITYDVWSTLDLCNTSWAEITRIPLINDGNRKIYTTLPVLSHTDIYPTPYASYFSGGYGYPGMCTVVNDGFGNLQISVNILSRTSGNPNIDTTLNNVSDLLYYYSGAAGRVANISAPIGINQTLVFDGFNANGTVQTRILLAPTG